MQINQAELSNTINDTGTIIQQRQENIFCNIGHMNQTMSYSKDHILCRRNNFFPMIPGSLTDTGKKHSDLSWQQLTEQALFYWVTIIQSISFPMKKPVRTLRITP